ncbi:carbohydrate esterase family 16 protein [Mucor lusitanicus]|uniref:Carbohydrate esterase family 16 protein n=2 Tax=Mucor circinelloides f. lusitanicus TaxID=29924 RepID=A0A168MNE4_MUCCL|nr:carbohydrate esterase family 16 protein [Mucor lusitanicus]OAD05166.1 carbohydrate esterase family 16 protein [Mucor lusitanicus CBS 277.49]
MKLTTLLPCLALSATAVSAFNKIITYADSLTDAGTDYALTGFPPAPYYKGRFTNGPVWLEHVEKELPGIEIINTANGGSTTNNEDVLYQFGTFIVPGLQQKILTTYVNGTSDDLYLLYIGYNDLNAIVNPIQYTIYDKHYNIQRITDNVIKSAELLVQMYGAKNFLIMNVIPFDQFPQVAKKDRKFAKKLITDYNALLEKKLPKSLPHADVKFLDDHAWFVDQLKHPERFGQETSNGPCAWGVGNTTACDDPEKHFFWDSAHPSKEVHAGLGAWAASQIKSLYHLD